MFVITLVGGNAPLLVPLATSLIAVSPPNVTIRFTANGSPADNGDDISYYVESENAVRLQLALAWVFGSLYLVSACLYLWATVILRQSADKPQTT